MLSGTIPFKGANVLQDILAGSYRFSHRAWQHVDASAIDLVKKLLRVDPNERVSLKEVLQHDW
eukprot:CAMPEP_0113904534 /NCGR_PEP_ID=MMETSP0780_2-20120614/23321_1 /TAXON_ID=652834 /ORGANISM="Palpitomonas bilix" /LENGTH=62 /DNA_ID=CAMNT_0000898185 /DNA_START=234 /DNA_END=419 /DNA_ORIENTATION=+ /assembly_acc=CAM_ASM_000599